MATRYFGDDLTLEQALARLMDDLDAGGLESPVSVQGGQLGPAPALRGGHGRQPDADPLGPGLSAGDSEQQLEAQLDVPGLAGGEDPAEGG